jgi:3-oxoacyl-[acyl-carrier-protein] synthase III
MAEVSIISDANSGVALISENNLATNAILFGDGDSAVIVGNSSASSVIINGNSASSSMVIASSVGAQGAQGDNDNAIAFSIALG